MDIVATFTLTKLDKEEREFTLCPRRYTNYEVNKHIYTIKYNNKWQISIPKLLCDAA